MKPKNIFKIYRLRTSFVIFILGIFGLFSVLFLLMNKLEESIHNNHNYSGLKGNKHPIILWWTPFTGEKGILKHCGGDICFFTDERKYFFDNMTKGLLFYGSDFKPTDLPVPRQPYHEWALLHEESPKNNYLFSTEEVMKLFNHTATFRRESDLSLTLQYLESLESLTSLKFFVTTSVKNSKAKNLAPVVYVQSDCNTPSERDLYVKELSKYIQVDSYGKCLHNKDLPAELTDAVISMNAEAFYKIISEYKFTISFENAVCQDYITEKLWRPLILGSVPVYYGSPSVKDWLPNPSAAILVTDFKSPKSLADYLLMVNADDKAYESHLQHKIQSKIANTKLRKVMSKREWGINNEPDENTFIDKFECMVCQRISYNYNREKQHLPVVPHIARVEHYGCPRPVSPITFDVNEDNWWLELYDKAKYEAKALINLLNTGRNFTATDFYQEVIKHLENES